MYFLVTYNGQSKLASAFHQANEKIDQYCAVIPGLNRCMNVWNVFILAKYNDLFV